VDEGGFGEDARREAAIAVGVRVLLRPRWRSAVVKTDVYSWNLSSVWVRKAYGKRESGGEMRR
jgi:hypothetical protein